MKLNHYSAVIALTTYDSLYFKGNKDSRTAPYLTVTMKTLTLCLYQVYTMHHCKNYYDKYKILILSNRTVKYSQQFEHMETFYS